MYVILNTDKSEKTVDFGQPKMLVLLAKDLPKLCEFEFL